jgi:2-oxoglutarate dehydrogenase E2 component (dihydrolipoamide succinyltransferase)
MSISITIPSPGESISEVTLGAWHKGDGEWVEKDDLLVEIESDKATLEVRAPQPGRLSVKSRTGSTLKVGAEVATVDPAAPRQPTEPTATRERSASSASPAAAASPAGTVPTTTGPTSPSPALSSPAISSPASGTEVKATPLARKVAAEKGVDLATLHGTGPSGRITKEDVLAAGGTPPSPAAMSGAPMAVVLPTHTNSLASPAPAHAAVPGVRRERMTRLRQRIAERLVEAQHTAAMLTTFNECDMTEVMRLRAEHKEGFEKSHGVGLGFMGFFVAASVSALRRFPRVNAFIVQGPDGPEIEQHDFMDIAVAIGTEKGLVVPVLRRAEHLSLADVERGIRDLALKARDGKLTIEEMSGGTFTISNGGVYGSLMSTPILNPPQSGILGMHAIKKRAVEDPAHPGQVVLRPMMYLALSYDHRMVDGAEAVGFLVHVKNCIEKPERLLLGV